MIGKNVIGSQGKMSIKLYYRNLEFFYSLLVNQDGLLIHKNGRQVVYQEQLYDILNTVHLTTGHGRNRIMRKACEIYHGIPKLVFVSNNN